MKTRGNPQSYTNKDSKHLAAALNHSKASPLMRFTKVSIGTDLSSITLLLRSFQTDQTTNMIAVLSLFLCCAVTPSLSKVHHSMKVLPIEGATAKRPSQFKTLFQRILMTTQPVRRWSTSSKWLWQKTHESLCGRPCFAHRSAVQILLQSPNQMKGPKISK